MPLINPYFDLFRILETLPPEMRLAARKKLIWAYAWAVPNEAAMTVLREHEPILEIGAGSGYWAWLARQTGARVRAYDRNAAAASPHWGEVLEGSTEQIREYPDHALLLCWPPLDEPLAEEALQEFQGGTLIYAGEHRGRTASSPFHDRLDSEFQRIREVPIPRWPGFEDRLDVYRRR